jgi:hypothetical protein
MPAGQPRTAPATYRTHPTGRPEASAAQRGTANRQPPNRPSRWRIVTVPLRWLVLTLVVIVPLAGLGAGLVYVKLLFGSIPLHFMVEPVREALLAELDDVDVSIGDAALHRSPAGGFEVRLTDVSLAARRGDTAVRASEAVVGLDLAALRSGRIAADRIVLVGPRLNLSQEMARLTAFAPSDAGHPAGQAGNASDPVKADAPPDAQPTDLARAIAEAVAHLRQGRKAASRLRTFGLRDATLEIDDHGRRTIWQVGEMEIALDHHRRHSVITGTGRISAGGVPFGVSFVVDQSEKSQTLKLTTTVEGLSLPALARNVPHLGLLAALDAPISAHGEMELSSDGRLLNGRFDVDLGRGSVLPEALGGLAIGIDGGKLAFLFDGASNRLELAPSKVQLDGSWVRVKGELTPVSSGDRATGWELQLASIEGALAEVPGRPATAIDRLSLRARLWPASGASELLSFEFKAGGADLQAHGTMIGGENRSARLEGRIGPMDADTFKALWPAAISPALRGAVAQRLVHGRLKEGTFQITSGRAEAGTGGLSLALEAEDLAILPMPDLPPVTIPNAVLKRQGNRLELVVPEAQLVTAPNRRMSIKGVSVVVTDLDNARPEAEITGRAQSSLALVADLLGRDSVGLVHAGQVPAGTDGKVEAQWRAVLPVVEGSSLADAKIDAKVRITDGRIPNVFGTHDVSGGAFTIGATERAIDVKGELLLAGVPAKVNGQWIVGESTDRQSPMVISARLDNADRRRLGFSADDLIQGEFPLEMQVTPGVDDHSKVVVNADLTSAELSLDALSWRKPAGRSARLSFEVVRPRGSKNLELQGFRISGDLITVNGTVVLGPDGKPISYRFPGFSLDVVSNLEVEGVRRADKVWDVKARGKTFDGTAVMRSLYAVETKSKSASGDEPMDLDAQIDTVIGHNDTTVRQLRLKLKRRNDRIASIEMTATLDGGQPIRARMQSVEDGVMHVETPDAGQALRTIGFYSSMLGGKGDLWVDIDGSKGVERSGQIRINKFRVLGDPVVNELVQGADESRPAIAMGKARPSRRIVREEIAFDTLRGSFATGSGQVAIESLTAAGPLIGASVRGKMDFRTRAVSLGGTYVPLSGLNRVLAGIPIFGELLTGPRKDGVIGITFAVDGPMAKPNVIINPLSMVAPGVLREIFQMVPENPRVTPSDGDGPFGSGAQNGFGEPPAPPPRKRRPADKSKVLDGWSSQSSTVERR